MIILTDRPLCKSHHMMFGSGLVKARCALDVRLYEDPWCREARGECSLNPRGV